MPRPDEPLLNVQQVARRLSVCTATVYDLVARGALPHIRVIGAIRVRPADLESFIESGDRSPDPKVPRRR